MTKSQQNQTNDQNAEQVIVKFQAEIAELHQELESANATIEELKASKTTKTRVARPAKEKIVEKSVQKLSNADYVGRLLTKHSHQEVLDAISYVDSISDDSVFVKISGGVQINGQYHSLGKLTPITVEGELFFLLDTKEPVTPASDNTWDEAWVVAMRPSAAKRYYLGEKPEKKAAKE